MSPGAFAASDAERSLVCGAKLAPLKSERGEIAFYGCRPNRGRWDDDVEMKPIDDVVSSSAVTMTASPASRSTTVATATVPAAGAFVTYRNGRWYQVTMKRAREKIGRMLREFLHTQYKSSSKQKRALVRKRSLSSRSTGSSSNNQTTTTTPPSKRRSSPW